MSKRYLLMKVARIPSSVKEFVTVKYSDKREWRSIFLEKSHLYTKIATHALLAIFVSPSSRGLGHCPFTAVTGVRIPLGTPLR